MEWIVTTAPTVDAAKDLALDRLGVDASEAEFEVLEEPRAGLFGRVRGEARVRARVRPTRPRPKVERRDRRKGSGRPAGAKRSGRKAGGRAPADRTEGRDRPPTEPVSATRPPEKKKTPAPDRSASTRPTPPTSVPSPAKDANVSEITLDQQGDAVADFLSGLLDAFDLDGDVEISTVDDEMLEVAVQGDDLGLLIGPRGQTLQAIQELARASSMQALPGRHPGRVRIDVSGYRQRRREALEAFTRKVADDVLESGTAKALEPMPAADRKVVHDTVNDIDGVQTLSEGEEPRRRVVIEPT